MSICGGIAGIRGKNPVGIFIHNDAGSQNANAAFYGRWLQSHPLEDGFAHYYVADDSTLQAEEDAYCAWHCAQTDGNTNYLSIEVCQSMGDLEIFKRNEEKALRLAAEKCKQYGITPGANTIKLHREVYATACPHRSAEIHGGYDGVKAYFIKRIAELMSGNVGEPDYSGNTSGDGQGGNGNQQQTGDAGVVFSYAVRIEGGIILPFVDNLQDFAGLAGRRITDVAIRVNKGKLWYRVHILDGGWLPPVSGCDWNEPMNGYAGNGQVIDAVQVYYETPGDIVGRFGYQKAQYRISPLNGGYYPWQFDDETGNGQDGYAGMFGVAMDRFQLF